MVGWGTTGGREFHTPHRDGDEDRALETRLGLAMGGAGLLLLLQGLAGVERRDGPLRRRFRGGIQWEEGKMAFGAVLQPGWM